MGDHLGTPGVVGFGKKLIKNEVTKLSPCISSYPKILSLKSNSKRQTRQSKAKQGKAWSLGISLVIMMQILMERNCHNFIGM